MRACVCEREREGGRESVCTCVCERERKTVRVCVCAREREGERKCVYVCVREREMVTILSTHKGHTYPINPYVTFDTKS